jgi:hypothetical protein
MGERTAIMDIEIQTAIKIRTAVSITALTASEDPDFFRFFRGFFGFFFAATGTLFYRHIEPVSKLIIKRYLCPNFLLLTLRKRPRICKQTT